MPDLNDIRLVLAARGRVSFGAVARDLHVSQSTVSRAVQRIEAELGCELFLREGRSVQPSPEAAPLFDGLQTLSDDWDRIILSARTAESPELRVFCTVTASQLIAPPLFEQFRRVRPDVHVDLRTGSANAAIPSVQDSSVDVAIAPLPARLPAGLVTRALRTTPFVAVALKRVRSFDNQPVVLSRQGLLREVSEKWVRKHLGSVSIQEAETNEEVLALAAMGAGIAVVPRLVVEASPLAGRVHEVALPAPLPIITVGLVAKRSMAASDPLAALLALA
jgi:LysR family transcriptional regulator, positive regulator for ilvC